MDRDASITSVEWLRHVVGFVFMARSVRVCAVVRGVKCVVYRLGAVGISCAAYRAWVAHKASVACAALVVRTRHLFGAVRALLVACAPCASCIFNEVYSLCFTRHN